MKFWAHRLKDEQPGFRFKSFMIEMILSHLCDQGLDFSDLTREQREDFARRLPFQRTVGAEPSVSGYWSRDLTYSAGGRALDRASLRSYR